MIGEAELRRSAARSGVDPMVADLDYSLGWFVAALYSANALATTLRFKGGTCLRKCYFPNYRFSEDLDFTATRGLRPNELMRWIEQATLWATEADGPDFGGSAVRLEIVEDEYGSEAYQARVYCRGPLRWSGDPRAIRLDVTRQERLVLPPTTRHLIHPYSDQTTLAEANITCYTLTEIMAEKIRAVSGQRRFAISRDIYDIHRLAQYDITVSALIPLLPAKFAARGMDIAALDIRQLEARRAAFEKDWTRRLSYLVLDGGDLTFDSAWATTVALLRQLGECLTGHRTT